jgi:dienelactone hydrolase
MKIGRRSIALPVGLAALASVALGTSASAGPSPDTGSHARHEAVVVQDISIPVPGQDPVDAWLVRPDGHAAPGSLAGVIYLHWLEPPASNQNRSEFLDEAVRVASHGAVAILPDLTFPWTGTLLGDGRDVDAVKAQEFAVRTAYHALLAQPGVDPHRTAVVGHDYGAMYGSLLAASEPGIRAEVFMAGDATWSNWFAQFFLGLDPADVPAYDALFAGLDPVDNVARMHSHLYLQWSDSDFFLPDTIHDEFSAADPKAKVSVYADAPHFLDQRAKDDRIPWVLHQLGLH